MSTKRPRSTFEADLQAQQSPFTLYGTPLPPLDPEVRDDGSFVPVWKQEVRDERGRKRLHGAFTGGWSAGYFNTVGSKEGWTPSTFVSSRKNRQKDKDGGNGGDGSQGKDPDAAEGRKQRPEDFMDDEDLGDQADAEKLQTASDYAGLGATAKDKAQRAGGLAEIFRPQGETMGIRLLKRMGWKEGQGIGPKVSRKARLATGANGHDKSEDNSDTYHLFAPDNVTVITFVKKRDRTGLGYDGETGLASLTSALASAKGLDASSDEVEEPRPLMQTKSNALSKGKKKKTKLTRGGIGIGVLNDTGSDDEDPYEIGPRISYNRVIGGKEKKKKVNMSTIIGERPAPVFKPKKGAAVKGSKSTPKPSLRKCHDGRLPLDGFVFGTETDTTGFQLHNYPPPKIPPDWKSSKTCPTDASATLTYLSTSDAAKASKLDPKSRAEILGEAPLPGKSVFDFLSSASRDRIAAVTGKANLPQGLGEVPAGYSLTPEEREKDVLSQLSTLEKPTALAALSRGSAGSAPYADNEAKRSRYRAYLEYSAGFGTQPPKKPPPLSYEDWARELHEFHNCARIFKPMSGRMASRFTTASSTATVSGKTITDTDQDLLTRPPPKPADPAEEAANMSMYGTMTRSVASFCPTRLLCKRLGVKPPALVEPEAGSGPVAKRTAHPRDESYDIGSVGHFAAPSHAESAMTLDELLSQAQDQQLTAISVDVDRKPDAASAVDSAPVPASLEVDAEVNHAVEGASAQAEVLRAIFGDSSDEDDD